MRPSQISSTPPPLPPVETLEAGASVGLPENPPTHLAQRRDGDGDKIVEEVVSKWVSHLDNLEKHYECFANGSIVKNDVQSMKKGVEFLRKLFLLTLDGNLAKRMRQLAVSVKHDSLIISGEENEDLQRIRMTLVENIRGLRFFRLFDQTDSRDKYGEIIDLILENISVLKSNWYNNSNATVEGETVSLEKKLGELRLALTYYKPFCVCFAHSSQLLQVDTSLDSLLNDVVRVIYLLFIDKMDKKTIESLNGFMHYVQDIGLRIYDEFLKVRDVQLTYQGKFYILDNLIHILATNSNFLNEPNKHLYEELNELRTVVGGSEMLIYFLDLTESESICYQALPIVSSIYVEEDVHRKLDHILKSVVHQIKLIKLRSASQEIKLYDYPKVDGMGFLKFFLGNLKELQQHDKISVIWSKIETLHMDIQCLVSSFKTSDEKFPNGELRTHIVRLAYEAEHVIDLYRVIPDARCVSTLANTIEEVKEKKEKVLALADKRPHVEDVASTTSIPTHDIPLHGNNVLVGFQEEIVAIKKDLLAGESDLQVISIVGMAGAGKTSLAKHLFEECSNIGHFDKKAWCTTSQTYQMKDLLHTLLAQTNPSENRDMDDQMLADTFCRSLKGRRYLVVIDDVWDVSIWNYLHRYFPHEKTKSRILITTRDYNVAPETKSKVHHLRPLTMDESWELLQKKLTQQETKESLPKYIESIGKEVAMSCKGLPLSIVIIGSLLHHASRNEEMWNQIAKDVTSTILSDPGGKCKVILELSYNHLPDNLKACFLYLGVFPEDHKISFTRLVRLWVAEGFVRGRIASDVSVEDVGKRYVDDLIKRNLVIPIKEKIEGRVESIQLHDLLRDFCLKKAEEEHFFAMLDSGGTFHSPLYPRRMSINGHTQMNLLSCGWNSVRTLISFYRSFEIEWIMECGSVLLLNVLDVDELSESAYRCVHRCVHLRYLAIWNLRTREDFLCESPVFKLLNLQVLILHCKNSYSIIVPDSIWEMGKLRHIDIRFYCVFSFSDWKKIEDSTVLLENLKSFSTVLLDYRSENWLRKFPKLEKLSCKLSDERPFRKLDHCNRLTSLKVESFLSEGKKYRRCKFHLPASLRKLSLTRFTLDSDDISEIGKSLLNLEELELVDSLQSWSSTDEDFPKLKILRITTSSFCEWNVTEEAFPNIEQLWLFECHSLEEIPLTFADSLNLRLISVRYCKPSLYESAMHIEKIQLEASNTELKLDLNRDN